MILLLICNSVVLYDAALILRRKMRRNKRKMKKKVKVLLHPLEKKKRLFLSIISFSSVIFFCSVVLLVPSVARFTLSGRVYGDFGGVFVRPCSSIVYSSYVQFTSSESSSFCVGETICTLDVPAFVGELKGSVG